MPWEPVPVAETVALLQQDFAYAIKYTAVLVHSARPELRMLINTARGQIIPRGECKFTDGTTIEFQDVGMPQVGVEEMSLQDLIDRVYNAARMIGLEIAT